MGSAPLPFSSLQLSPILNRMTDTWHIGNPAVINKNKKTLKPKFLTFSVCLIFSLSSFLLFYCSTPPNSQLWKSKSSFFSLLPLHKFPFLICFSLHHFLVSPFLCLCQHFVCKSLIKITMFSELHLNGLAQDLRYQILNKLIKRNDNHLIMLVGIHVWIMIWRGRG